MDNELDIDIEFLKRDLTVRELYAQAILHEIEKTETNSYYDKLAIAATNLKIASSHAILLKDKIKFDTLLIQSANHYTQWGSPYSQLLFSLKPQYFLENHINFIYFENYFSNYRKQIESKNNKIAQYIYLIFFLNNSDIYADILTEIVTKIEPLKYLKIGTLGISIGNYLEVFNYKKHNYPEIKEPNNQLKQILEPFLFNYDYALKQAQSNRYRFRKLSMNFHPIDFDVLAVLNFISSSQNVKRIIDESSISLQSKKVLKFALAFINPDEPENEFTDINPHLPTGDFTLKRENESGG